MVALSALYLGLLRLPQPALAASIHLSLAIVFLTIAIPLKASGSWITISWLVEGVALLWLSTRSETSPPLASPVALTPDRVLRLLAAASLLLGFGGVLFNLIDPFGPAKSAFINRPFATALAGLAAFAAAVLIARQSAAPNASAWLSLRHIGAAATIAFNLVALFAVVVQINLLFLPGATDADLQRALAVSTFLMLYGALLLALGFWRRSAFIRWQALLLLVFTIGKTFLYDMRNLSQGYRVLSFLGLGALLMAVSFAYQKDWLALRESPTPAPPAREIAE